MTMAKKETRVLTVTVKHREVVALTGPESGFTTKPLPDTHERVEVTIDWDALGRVIGSAACANRSGRARALNGIITAQRLGRV